MKGFLWSLAQGFIGALVAVVLAAVARYVWEDAVLYGMIFTVLVMVCVNRVFLDEIRDDVKKLKDR